jgi:O-methyltransferase
MLTAVKRAARRAVDRLRGRALQADPLADLPPIGVAELDSIWRQVEAFTMTSRERVGALLRAAAHIEQAGVRGAIVECGVWRGGSMMAAALALLRRGSSDRRLFLFDTFAGMPPPGPHDRDMLDRTAAAVLGEADFATSRMWGFCPLPAVRAAMSRTSYPSERVHYVEGRVEDTVPKAAPAEIALLRLDTDWHASTAHELEHLYPRLTTNGVLIVDDYGHWQGARRAVDEYFARLPHRPRLREIDYTGRLLIKNE